MNLPVDTLRQQIYNALNGQISGFTVYSWPPKSAGNYVLIGDVRMHESTAQSYPIYECYVPLEIVYKTVVRDNTQDSKKPAATAATSIDAIMRPGLVTFITVSGWTVAGCYLDDKSEDLTTEADTAIFRIQLIYYIRIVKQ